MDFQARFESLGLQLPPPPKAVGVYRPLYVVGNLAYASGHGPLLPDGTLIKGRVGDQLTVEEGYQAARQTGLAMLATLVDQLGSLNRVARLVKTLGLVNATAELTEQPAVINGFSELMHDVFGDEAGIGVRSAFGVASLPAGMAVEVEAVFEVQPQ